MRVLIAGLGHVGRALLRAWPRLDGSGLRLVAAADSRGVWHNEAGLDPAGVLAAKSRRESGERHGSTAQAIRELKPDVLVELTITDLEHGAPAVDDICAALAAGAHVVTSAKSHHKDLATRKHVDALARDRGRIFVDHASMLAGIPATEMMAGIGMEVKELVGVINGTTNFIIERLEEGETFEAALAEAQRRGFTEKDPRYDIEGLDVAVKLVGLAYRFMGLELDAHAIIRGGLKDGRRGIAGIGPKDLAAARLRGQTLRLVGEVRREGAGAQAHAQVQPRWVELKSPFGRVRGFHNAIELRGRFNDTDMTLFLQGPGAGADETASRVLGNLRDLARRVGDSP